MLLVVFVSLSLVALALVSCGLDEGNAEHILIIGEETVIKGKIVEIDLTPMYVDGHGTLHISTVERKEIIVSIPSGESQPQAKGLELVGWLKKGDEVEIKGEITEKNGMTIFKATHYLKKLTLNK